MEEKELEKMTAPELREYILQNYPEITGVHALKKEELLAAIYKARGEAVKEPKKKAVKEAELNKKELKKQIRLLKVEKEKLLQAPKKNKKALGQIRKKIKRLKRLTKKAA
jgi:predicted  nucleic acid-binding Zn-ribbon protein